VNQIVFLLGCAVRNIYRRPLAACGSFLSALLLLLLFDLVWISALSSRNYYDRLIADIDMEIFVADNLPDSTLERIRFSIGKMDGVDKVALITKDAARILLSDLMGVDLLEGLEDNPLPRSMTIAFRRGFASLAALEKIRSRLLEYEGITEIFYAKQWLERAEYARAMISRITLFLGLVIFSALALNLFGSIRLSALDHKEELAQLRLLGAGRVFLTLPYILEGFIYSALASLAGWVLIHYGAEYFAYRNLAVIFPSNLDIFYFCLSASMVGMLGGAVGIRRAL
jgi:cell division transport system permease protein